ITLFSVNIFWVFFRAKDLAGAVKVLKAMVDYRSIGSLITLSYRETATPYLGNLFTLLILILSIIIVLLSKNSKEKERAIKLNKVNLLENIFYILASIALFERITTFLYFNF
ncbi:MAG: MBOAT family protein, partial [Cetobacterium sp.]